MFHVANIITFHMKQNKKQGKNNVIGGYGEDIVVRYVDRMGWTVLEVNYLKPWGEIDVIALDLSKTVHFIEVKTVSYETKCAMQDAVSRATYRPEENVHPRKILRLQRTIATWLEEKNSQAEWQIDVVAVRIVPCEKYATIKIIPNIL